MVRIVCSDISDQILRDREKVEKTKLTCKISDSFEAEQQGPLLQLLHQQQPSLLSSSVACDRRDLCSLRLDFLFSIEPFCNRRGKKYVHFVYVQFPAGGWDNGWLGERACKLHL